MKINEVATLTGITVRTLHYYDEIGLLKPSEITAAGYRLYDNAALDTLQQILFFREMDFSLQEIKEIMQNPHYDKNEALAKHRELLLQKRKRLDALIFLVTTTLQGETDMSFKQFDKTELETAKSQYAAEAKERWGDTDAYAEHAKKTSAYTDANWQAAQAESEAILTEFGKLRATPPESEAAQALVKKWQDYITANFYQCTPEILSGLGSMYVSDAQFTQNIDKHGAGTGAFMAEAIAVFCAHPL